MFKNGIISVLLVLTVLIGTLAVSIMAEDGIKVVLNGEELIFDVPPQLINDRTMVPMRKIFESLGADVKWEGESQTITATKDDIVIIMQIDNVIITVKGVDIELDVPPQLIDSRTLVPVRAVAEGLDVVVGWDDETNTVILTKDMEVTPVVSELKLRDAKDTLDGWMFIESQSPTYLTDSQGNKYTSGMYFSYYNSGSFTTTLNKKYSTFKGTLYVLKNSVLSGTANFSVLSDGIEIYKSPDITKDSAPMPFSVDIRGCTEFSIVYRGAKDAVFFGDAGFFE